jgi:hypothetical protein
VLVAEDAEISLYATTNDEGSYCLVVSAPWKRPATLPDGGTCIPPAQAAAPLIAGLVGASSPTSERGQWTLVIAGRTDEREARTIAFVDPNGETMTRPIGSSGFFVASVHMAEAPCAGGDWKPTFVAAGKDGQELARATITLGSARSGDVCTFAAPHA